MEMYLAILQSLSVIHSLPHFLQHGHVKHGRVNDNTAAVYLPSPKLSSFVSTPYDCKAPSWSEKILKPVILSTFG